VPEIATRSPQNPEFARVVDVARLRGLREFPFDLAPDPAEARALARLMGARSVRKLRFRGRLEPAPAPPGSWRLEGTLGATVTQSCVVSLEPVTTRIDAPVSRIFVPGHMPSAELAAEEVGEEDEVEALGPTIDLGLVAIEALALALPAYPRATGATLEGAASAPPGAAPLAGGEVRPFAALAALRAKLEDGG